MNVGRNNSTVLWNHTGRKLFTCDGGDCTFIGTTVLWACLMSEEQAVLSTNAGRKLNKIYYYHTIIAYFTTPICLN